MSTIESTITAVTVYPDRARIHRQGTASLDPGTQRLEFRDLPLVLDPASVRAAARGTARARLLGVDVRRSYYAETPDEVVRELETEIEALEDEIATSAAQSKRLQEEREAVQGLLGAAEVYARGLAFGKTTPANQMALFDSLRQRMASLDSQLHTLATAHRGRERRLQKLRKELEALRSAKGKERYSAVVEVEVAEAGSLALELTYVVRECGWTPLYDIRLAAQAEDLEVGYLAEVVQRTGEGWPEVNMTLSTARPALAGTLPELFPWYMGPRPRPQKRAFQTQALMRAAPAPAALEDAVPHEEMMLFEAEVATTTIDRSGAAVSYVLPGPVTIPSDGTPHKVTVAQFPLSPSLDYVSAPKLVEAAYRRAQVANDSPYTLLPGAANLFVGEEFIGSTSLDLTAPGGEIELYLGVDDRVRIQRELKRRDVDKRRLGDRRRVAYGYQIEVQNLLETETTVTVHDQIPVARHEQIKSRLEFSEPKPSSESELGLLEWELTLAPQQERIVRFDFVVEFPSDLEVVGLP